MALFIVEVTRVFRYVVEAPNGDAAAEIAAAEVSRQFDIGAVVMETSATTEVSVRVHGEG